MSGLLYRRVVDLAYEVVPQAILHDWRERAVATAQRSLRMQRQLLQVLDALERGGVPALAFKGPALSQQLYGDAGVRHFVDLDVLIGPEHAVAAREAMLRSGYVDAVPLEPAALTLLVNAEHHIGFVDVETGLDVEVHWRIGPRFAADSLPADRLLARSGTTQVLQRAVRTLGSLDVALMLTVHASKDGWAELEDVAAVAAALRRLTPAEAATLPALALEHGCQRRLHVGVLLASTLAEQDLPALLTRPAHDDRRAKDIASRAGARLVWSVMAPAVLDTSDPRARAQGVFYEAVGLDTRGATARHLWRRLTTAGARDWPEPAASPTPTEAEDPSPVSDAGGSSIPRPAPGQGPGPLSRARTFFRRQRRIWKPPGSGGH